MATGQNWPYRPIAEVYHDDPRPAGKFHPFSTEKALTYTGRRAFGLPVDAIW